MRIAKWCVYVLGERRPEYAVSYKEQIVLSEVLCLCFGGLLSWGGSRGLRRTGRRDFLDGTVAAAAC